MAGIEKFSLASLATIDNGRIAANFQQLLETAIKDCQDRPNDEKPRKLMIELQIAPVVGTQNGQVICEGVNGAFQLKSSVPTRKTAVYSFGLRTQGKDNKPVMIYNDASLGNVDQSTFFDNESVEE